MLLTLVFLAITTGATYGKNVTVFMGYNPYDWKDTNTILYDYRGFFKPMVDLVKQETESSWTWSQSINVNIETTTIAKDSTSRSLTTWAPLKTIFDIEDSKDLYGIIGVAHCSEGAMGSEMSNVAYIHTYHDNYKNTQMEKSGVDKNAQFRSTIRLAPSINTISHGVIDFIHWFNGVKKGAFKDEAELLVFHENTFASEKIAQAIRSIAVASYEWDVFLRSFESDVYSGVTTDSAYLFSERLSRRDFFTEKCEEALYETRGRCLYIK